MADDAAAFLGDAGHKAGDIDEGDQGDVENVAETDEAGAFVRGVDVEGAGFDGGVVGNDADDDALDAGETDDDVRGEERVNLEEGVGVGEAGDDAMYVKRSFGVLGDELVHLRVGREVQLGLGRVGRVLEVVGRDVGEQLARKLDGVGRRCRRRNGRCR